MEKTQALPSKEGDKGVREKGYNAFADCVRKLSRENE